MLRKYTTLKPVHYALCQRQICNFHESNINNDNADSEGQYAPPYSVLNSHCSQKMKLNTNKLAQKVCNVICKLLLMMLFHELNFELWSSFTAVSVKTSSSSPAEN